MPKKIFLSHSHDSSDQTVAKALQEAIVQCCPEDTRVFRSSDVQSKNMIAYGEDWYRRINEELQNTNALIALVTPSSSLKPWILYETGFACGKGVELLYGIMIGPHSTASLGPLSQLQAAFFTRDGLQKVFHELVKFTGSHPVDTQLEPLVRNLLTRVAVPLNQINRSSLNREEQGAVSLNISDRILSSIDLLLSQRRHSADIYDLLRRWIAAASLCLGAVPWLEFILHPLHEATVSRDNSRIRTYCQELNYSLTFIDELTPDPQLADASAILAYHLDFIIQHLGN